MTRTDLLTPLLATRSRPRPHSPHEWEDLLGQARQARLLSRLATHHEDHGALEALPEGPRRQLQAALRWMARQHHAVHWEVDCIARALVAVPTPVVLLKGAAYLMAGLPPAHGRLFADIDLLVARPALHASEGALLAAGWVGMDQDAYDQRYYRDWMHELPPVTHVQRQSVIDVHHTITPPTSRFAVDGARLLERALPIDSQRRLFVLAPEDMVLHSAAHLFSEGEWDHGLRDLLDLDDLLRHFEADAGFWPRLFDRAGELALQVPLFHALTHVQRLFGTAPPAALAARVQRPAWAGRVLMSALLARALRPMHPSCEAPGDALARSLLYVRSHYLRMPMRLLVPHLARKAWMRRFSPPREGAQP